MKKLPYLRSRQRRGKWFHTYRRGGLEKSLGVHGLHPSDPQVLAAWSAEHAQWQDRPSGIETPDTGTFAWALDLYLSGNDACKRYADGTRSARLAIFARYRATQDARPISTITSESIERALYIKGGHGAVNEAKALKPVFDHLRRLGFIRKNPLSGIQVDRPKIEGFKVANAEDIAAFQER